MSSDEPVIEVKQISKCYHVYGRPSDRLKQFLVPRLRRWLGLTPASAYFREFWSLREVSLSVKRGEVLGLLGVNGAGKSTLLQLICGVLQPTAGSIKVNGRIAALLELGAGFNPEFTGRENVFLNASLLGLSEAEIRQHLPEIIEFSGLSQFIDQPVKTYSSGMYVRLAFSIATSVHPDILIVDEALSVGDGAFARKSLDRILAMREQGVTIIFCTHSLFQVDALCTRAVWLDAGRVRLIGSAAQVTAQYQDYLDTLSHVEKVTPPIDFKRSVPTTQGYARLRSLTVMCDGVVGQELRAISGRSRVSVQLAFDSDPNLETPGAAVTISTADGRILTSCGSWVDGIALARSADGRGTATLHFESIPLLKGRYSVSAYLFCERGLHIYTAADGVASLHVEQDSVEQGLFRIPHRWATEVGYSDQSLTVADSKQLAPSGSVSELALPALVMDGEWSVRWQTRWATAADVGALQGLFREAFATEMSELRWLWKYREARAWGTAVVVGERLVGFYGGMPRRCFLNDQMLQAVQVGDVMVCPAERSTGRSGPLMRASASYIDNMPALYPELAFAFGFPSERPMRLGVALGLYHPIDIIQALSWHPSKSSRSWFFRTRRLSSANFQANAAKLNTLWRRMRQDFSSYILPERDAARWCYRYLDHPEVEYDIVVIEHRFLPSPVAAFVVRKHDVYLELIDVLAGRSGLLAAIKFARQWASELGVDRLTGWFSGAIAPLFSRDCFEMMPTGLQVPTNLRGRSVQEANLPGPLWLMAGDTDFR